MEKGIKIGGPITAVDDRATKKDGDTLIVCAVNGNTIDKLLFSKLIVKLHETKLNGLEFLENSIDVIEGAVGLPY